MDSIYNELILQLHFLYRSSRLYPTILNQRRVLSLLPELKTPTILRIQKSLLALLLTTQIIHTYRFVRLRGKSAE